MNNCSKHNTGTGRCACGGGSCMVDLQRKVHVSDVSYECRIMQLESELAEARKDQARYQWLRSQNWNKSNLCVVTKPNLNVKIGAYCPSLDFLDGAIDAEIKEQQ